MANQTGKKRNRKGKGRRQNGKGKQGDDDTKKQKLSSDTASGAPSYKEHDTRLINITEAGQTWYQYGESLQSHIVSKMGKSGEGKSEEFVSSHRKAANEIFRREVQIFSGGGDQRWVESTIRKGTLKDRIAAMSVTVSRYPIHKFHALDGLLQMAGGTSEAGQANSRVAQLAAEALEDLFLNTLLPPDRKLRTLEERPLPSLDDGSVKKTLSPRLLLLWRYEEMVKEKYEFFIRSYMTRTLREGLEMTKIAALRTGSALLRSVPEGEALLLGLIANKLGDPQKKTAAAAALELRAVVNAHPNMKVVIAREVQQLAHRPHLSPRALYNCVAFLNQLKLDAASGENSLPAELITTYFKLFEVAIRSAGDPGVNHEIRAKSRLLQALLIGINRAHPYLPEKDWHMDGHIDELYRVVHTAPPGAVTQALTLLFHISIGSPTTKISPQRAKQGKESQSRADRYYRALFSALCTINLLSHGKHSTMFFNVLYKSLKFDQDSGRVVAFAQRLLSTALHCSPPSLAASIFVLNQVASHHEELLFCLEEFPEKESAKTILHPSKREPRAAFTSHGDNTSRTRKEDENITKGLRRPSSWELSLTSHHYHPSVLKFSSSAGSIKYDGDPFQDFGLAPFLDKFAYRNPRAVKNGSKSVGVGQRRDSMTSRLPPPVNDPSFLKRNDTEIHDDFFRKFFVERASRVKVFGAKRKVVDEDGALDLAENNLDDFSEFERNWESDSEEEAFVDCLAQKMLVENAAGAPVDIDDDLDMDDWGDLLDEGSMSNKGAVQYHRRWEHPTRSPGE